ncbi:hypothetical protein BDW22DRAFT_375262 [Trametopsis cervina]|nr:hypothetical protein BDW22DRAFT_375262 [Trametopsis cervina]
MQSDGNSAVMRGTASYQALHIKYDHAGHQWAPEAAERRQGRPSACLALALAAGAGAGAGCKVWVSDGRRRRYTATHPLLQVLQEALEQLQLEQALSTGTATFCGCNGLRVDGGEDTSSCLLLMFFYHREAAFISSALYACILTAQIKKCSRP